MAIPDRGGSSARGPRALSDLLGELFAARGLSRLQARTDLESAWRTAVGEPASKWSRIESLDRGIVSVAVAHPVLLEELRSYQRARILQALRLALPDAAIHDIRFRIGPIDESATGDRSPNPQPGSTENRPARNSGGGASPRPRRRGRSES